MRVKLSSKSMDVVMFVVRKYGISIDKSIDFIIENPEIIVFTRGEINGNEKSALKLQENLQSLPVL